MNKLITRSTRYTDPEEIMKTLVPEGQESRQGFRSSGDAQERRAFAVAATGDRRGRGFRNRRRGEFTRRLAECLSTSHEFRSMLYASLDRPYVPGETGADENNNGDGSVGALSRIFIWRR